MKNFFANIWTKRVASFFCIPYLLIVIFFAYKSFMFSIEVADRKMFLLAFIAISLFFACFVVYTRKQIVTRAVGIILVPMLLPIFLFNFGQWFLIIPFAVVVVFTFFAVGTSEATKTILGTIYLLFIILSTLAYFVYYTLFDTSANLVLSNTVVSPSGEFRANVYTISTVLPNNARVLVEPNDRDEDYKYVRFVLKGFEKLCYYNTASSEAVPEWKIDEDGNEILYLANAPEKGQIFDESTDNSFPWNFLIFEITLDDEETKQTTSTSRGTDKAE